MILSLISLIIVGRFMGRNQFVGTDGALFCKTLALSFLGETWDANAMVVDDIQASVGPGQCLTIIDNLPVVSCISLATC